MHENKSSNLCCFFPMSFGKNVILSHTESKTVPVLVVSTSCEFLSALFVTSTAWISSHCHPENETRQDGKQEGRVMQPWSEAETLLAAVTSGFPSFHGGLGARTLTAPLNNEKNVWAAPASASVLTSRLSAAFLKNVLWPLFTPTTPHGKAHTLADVKTDTDGIYGWLGCLRR